MGQWTAGGGQYRGGGSVAPVDSGLASGVRVSPKPASAGHFVKMG